MTNEEFERRYKEIKDLQLSRVRSDIMDFEEADEVLNNATRAMIQLFRERHKHLWFGNVNLYEETRHRPVLVPDEGQKIYNFEYSFMVPCVDTELVMMIVERDQAEYTSMKDDFKRVEKIIRRITDIGGEHLHWS